MFLGTFFGIILEAMFGINEGPLWANAVGVICGCLLGIYIPVLILGNNKTKGLYKAENVVLGAMKLDELEG